MPDKKDLCEICKQLPSEFKCTCGNKTCEECGHSKQLHQGKIHAREVWECVNCEFGPGDGL